MADDVQYEFKTVQAVRGTESRSITKWQNQGWELVDQTPGKVRTTLRFRRPKRKVPWIPIAALLSVGILILAVVGIVAAVRGGGDDDAAPASGTVASDAPTQTPSEAATPSETPSEESAESPSASDDPNQVLTAENNEELDALLMTKDECGKAIKTFASEYAGRTIEFDGSIADMANHGNYQTRYDILIVPGDKGPNTTVGPYFKFEDVNTLDLNFTGRTPDYFGTGDRLHIIAEVGNYNPGTCLFFLDPVSTEFRN